MSTGMKERQTQRGGSCYSVVVKTCCFVSGSSSGERVSVSEGRAEETRRGALWGLLLLLFPLICFDTIPKTQKKENNKSHFLPEQEEKCLRSYLDQRISSSR